MERRARLVILAVALVLIVKLAQEQAVRRISAIPAPPPMATAHLRLDPAGDLPARVIALKDPVELDGLSRQAIFEMRAQSVREQSDLLDGDYQVSDVFTRIVDGKPWWGIDGQFCKGPGQESILGPAEESRFLLNPFLLVGIDEAKTYPSNKNTPGCRGFYPHPVSLQWDPVEARGVVRYDITNFLTEWRKYPSQYSTTFTLSLVDMNARDLGFQYMGVDRKNSRGVEPLRQNRVFAEVVPTRGFIHTGGSCGYPGGCNNGSPAQPEYDFRVARLPAVMTCKLWKAPPRKLSQPADFTFVIEFE